MSLQQKIWNTLEPPIAPSKMARIVGWGISVLIIISTCAIILESMPAWNARFHQWFFALEMFCLAVFATEYCVRLWASASQEPRMPRWRYALRPMMIIDFLAFAPSLLLLFDASLNLAFLRVLRLMRIFKFTPYWRSSAILVSALRQSTSNLMIALFMMALMVLIAACVLHVLEAEAQPDKFGSIPQAMWWSIVTLTTVGYGDVVPLTPMGKFLGAMIIISGLGFVALPAGILATAFIEFGQRRQILQDAINRLKGDESPKARKQIEELRTRLMSAESVDDIVTETEADKAQFCQHCGKSLKS